MQLGMIGLGRMGDNMVRRLLRAGHACVVHDRKPLAISQLVEEGAIAAVTLRQMVAALSRPRLVWLMVPAAVVDALLAELEPLLESGDIVIDGGNSNYRDDIRRAAGLHARDIHHLDVGTSGGVAGLDRGYCLMVGGEAAAFELLQPIFASLAPGVAAASATPGHRRKTPCSCSTWTTRCSTTTGASQTSLYLGLCAATHRRSHRAARLCFGDSPLGRRIPPDRRNVQAFLSIAMKGSHVTQRE